MNRNQDIWTNRKQKSKKQVEHALSCGTHREKEGRRIKRN